MGSEKNIRHLDLPTVGSNFGVVDISKSLHSGSLGDQTASTPMSPSSVYAQKMLLGISQCFLDAIAFCHWDNILGPRLEHVWFVDKRPKPHHNILRFITSQVLTGEICRELNTNRIDFKFFDIPEKGIVIPSFVFSAKKGIDLGLHALAVVIPNSELGLFLQVSTLFQSWFNRIISKFRVLLEKNSFGEEDMETVSDWLSNCLQMLSSLQESGLPQTIHSLCSFWSFSLDLFLSDWKFLKGVVWRHGLYQRPHTILSYKPTNLQTLILQSLRWLSYTALCPSCNLEQDFLQQAIASHLMTFGRSIVVGRIPERVNRVIHTLALFSWESERVCSRLVVEGKEWPYAHDLSIQGILKNKDGSYDLPLPDLFVSKYPSTIIDVQKRDVKQSSSISEHPHRSQASAVEELNQLYNQTAQEPSYSGTFQPADVPETLIKTLLDELHKLPVQSGIREAFVTHFMHLLQRRALTLIKHVEVETERGSHSLKGGLKKLRSDLNLPLEGDLRIVLAAAEKLKPGVCQILFGERRYDTEYLPNVDNF